MNNTKTIFKSLLITVMALSLLAVSCSKDEGGTKTPTNPAKPITITAQSITDSINAALKSTVMAFTYDADKKTATATAAATKQEDLDALKTLNITIDGANVKVKDTTTKFPAFDGTDNITITITITPASGNSFDEKNLTPYTAIDGKVEVTLTLSPANSKKWNEATV